MGEEKKTTKLNRLLGERLSGLFAGLPLAFKTQAIVGATLLSLFTIAVFASIVTLRSSFFRFEKTDINNELDRGSLLLEEQLNSLGRFCRDYAQWDDTVAFMDGGKPDYIASNITPDTFNNLDIDIFVIFRPDGTVVHQAMRPGKIPRNEGYDLSVRADGLGNTPQAILSEIAFHKELLKLNGKEDATRGIISIKSGLLLVGISPVLKTDGSGRARGVLIMAKFVDYQRMKKYTSEIQANFSLENIPNGHRKDFTGKPVVEISGSEIASSKLIPGLLRRGAFQLKISDHRDLLVQLRTSETILLLNLIVMGIVCVIIVGAVLHRVALKRIREFSKRADRIRQSPADALRMPIGGRDELDNLALAINELLDELRETEARLSYDSVHDSLTDLGNRNLLMNRLEVAHALLLRDPNYEFALFLIDLDSFKNINDAFGHSAGDEVLRETSRRLKEIAGKTDTIVRLGGDEFVVLQMDVKGLDHCDLMAQNIVSSMARPINWENHVLEITASVGVFYSIARCAGCSPSELLRDVDIAMYLAKQEGKNRHKYFACGQREVVAEKLSLAQELKTAPEKGELEVWYQPLIAISSGGIESMEALVRWRHPVRGLLGPTLFIPLAEESNLIVALDTWMLYSALKGLARLRRIDPNLRVSVNFSVRQMSQPDIIEMVDNALQKAGLPPEALCIELTETALATNEESLFEPMRKLMQKGINIYMDDFGTGYSSLGRLNLLPVNVIKMDREFVLRIDKGDKQIVRAVIDMAHALDKKVVAEGVETKTQTDVLTSLGCDYLQGFRFSRPLPEVDVARFLKRHTPWQIAENYEDI